MTAATDTWANIVAQLGDLIPACESKKCRKGHPQATHQASCILPCHRTDLMVCAACADRISRELDKARARDERRGTTRGTLCIVCQTGHKVPIYVAVEIVAL